MSGNTSGTRQGVSFGPFRLYPAERLLEKDGTAIQLGSRALDLLMALVEKAGEVVGKEELISRAWPDLTVDESSLRFHIAGLRKVLGHGQSGARYITNIPGRGYCLVAPTASVGGELQAVADLPQRSRPAHGLPHRLGRMVGRDETVQRINEHLGRKRFVTILGPGGIGKTAVAVSVAHAQLDAFGGAVCFLDLAPLADPALVGSALASALGVIAQSSDPTPEIVDFLRDRRMLIALDSCEHVISAAAAIAEGIYQEAPGVSILATSRERLRVEGEHVVELSPLDRPPDERELTAAQVLSFSAPRLFAERAAAGGYGVELTDADAAVVAEVCRKLDGIPLAIELVASRVAAHGLRETAALLDGRLRLLWRGRRTALPRHQTLEAALDWSCDLISDGELSVLRRLSIFVGPFVLAGAEAIGTDHDLGKAQVVQALEGLVARSLVSAQHDEAATQYRLLDTTRAYARQKLAESGELERIARCHAVHVCNALREDRASSVGGDRLRSQAATARALLGDVHAALKWSFSDQGDPEIGVNLAAAAAGLFIELSLLNECRRWSERALSILDDISRETRIEMELNAALGHSLTFTEGNGEQARVALERALELAERLEDPRNQFRLVSRLHMYHRRTGEIARLLPIARRAEALAARIGDPVGIAAGHNHLGVSYHLAGNQAAARVHLETALRMAEFQRVAPGHFAFHRNPRIALARSLWLQGFPDQAIAAAKPLATETVAPDVVTYCIGLIWSATVFQWVGDWTAAKALTERLLAYSRTHSLKPYQAVALGMRGEALIQAGEFDDGVDLLRNAIASLHADRYELYTSGFGGSLALGLATSGRVGEARIVINEILSRVTDGDALNLPELLRVRGEIQAHQGDDDEAISSFHDAIGVADLQGALSWRLRIDISLARLRSGLPGSRGGREALAETYARFNEGFATADLRAARCLLGDLTAAEG